MYEKVLVVDNEPVILDLVKKILEQNKFEVCVASSGREGYEKAIRFRPDVILLDIDMPDMDGGEVATKLRKNPSTSNIPILFLTGLVEQSEVEENPKIGGYYYISKPFDVETMLHLIRKAIKGELT